MRHQEEWMTKKKSFRIHRKNLQKRFSIHNGRCSILAHSSHCNYLKLYASGIKKTCSPLSTAFFFFSIVWQIHSIIRNSGIMFPKRGHTKLMKKPMLYSPLPFICPMFNFLQHVIIKNPNLSGHDPTWDENGE